MQISLRFYSKYRRFCSKSHWFWRTSQKIGQNKGFGQNLQHFGQKLRNYEQNLKGVVLVSQNFEGFGEKLEKFLAKISMILYQWF